MEYIIYCLFDKTDEKQKPVYVGQTNGDLHSRLLNHRSDAHLGKVTHIHYYMRNVGINNICIKEILRCSTEQANKYEVIAMEILNPMCNIKRCCLSSYATNGDYKKAWREKNLKEERFKCDVCDKCFGDGNRLKVHYVKHSK